LVLESPELALKLELFLRRWWAEGGIKAIYVGLLRCDNNFYYLNLTLTFTNRHLVKYDHRRVTASDTRHIHAKRMKDTSSQAPGQGFVSRAGTVQFAAPKPPAFCKPVWKKRTCTMHMLDIAL